MFFQKKEEVIFIMDDTWLVFIGLDKLFTNFQKHARSHLLLIYAKWMWWLLNDSGSNLNDILLRIAVWWIDDCSKEKRNVCVDWMITFAKKKGGKEHAHIYLIGGACAANSSDVLSRLRDEALARIDMNFKEHHVYQSHENMWYKGHILILFLT